MDSNNTQYSATFFDATNTTEIDPDTVPDWELPGDEVTKTTYYNLILWLPFFLIPFSIVLFRLIKYGWKFYKVKSKGKDGEMELGVDPFMELSLTLTNNHEKLAQIKKIRKEQDEIKRWRERNQAPSQHPEPIANRIDLHAQSTNTPIDYLRVLRFKTSQTWSKKLSPEAFRRLFSASRFGRMWMIFQVTCTVIAIVNYIILTYAIHRADRKFVKRLDLALATVFLFDYMVSFYTSEDRLRFYFNPSSLIDLLSIIPPFVYVFISESSPYVWFLGLLRILRASRVLRTYRLISFQENEETRELTILGLSFINFLFLSASVINAFESLQGTRHDPPSLLTWHDSLYYIMVTFSTIGFGDLTPSTIPSRIVVMVLIVMVIVFVPLQTGKLSELYKSTNAYQRAKFVPTKLVAHVILTGAITQSAIIDFCREYFSNDPCSHIVILAEGIPSLEIRRLLRHPYYKHRVHYLCGTPLTLNDLKRASASKATGVFLLNTTAHGASLADSIQEDLQVTRGADSSLLMQSLVIKTTLPGLPIFIQVQDIKSKDLARHCGCDRTLCVDETKMTLIAKNCVVPGALTLIMNLVHSHLPNDTEFDELWKREYQDGASNSVFSFKFPPGFFSKTFEQSSLALFNAFGVTLLGIFRQETLILNPGKDYLIEQEDVALCIGSHGDEIILRICIYFADSEGVMNEVNELYSSSDKSSSPLQKNPTMVYDGSVMKSTSMFPEENSNVGDGGLQESSQNPSSATEISPYTISSPKQIPAKNKHVILCGYVTARAIRQFLYTLNVCQESANIENQIPVTILLESLPNITEGIWADIVAYSSVRLIKGTPLKKSNLIDAGIKECRSIVIFASLEKSNSDAELPDANSIFIVQMLKEEWPKVKFMVELIHGNNTKFLSMREQLSDLSNLRMEAILSNNSLSISDRIALYKQARNNEENNYGIFSSLMRFIFTKPKGSSTGGDSHSRFSATVQSNGAKYESLQEDGGDEAAVPMTSALVDKFQQEAELNESGLTAFPTYQFDRHFAAGMICTAAFTHSLTCQSYFRPYILGFVKQIIQRIELVPIEKAFVGQKYCHIYISMMQRDILVVGLYRKGAIWAGFKRDQMNLSTFDLNITKLPYVYTNCRASDIIQNDDCLFVLYKSQN